MRWGWRKTSPRAGSNSPGIMYIISMVISVGAAPTSHAILTPSPSTPGNPEGSEVFAPLVARVFLYHLRVVPEAARTDDHRLGPGLDRFSRRIFGENADDPILLLQDLPHRGLEEDLHPHLLRLFREYPDHGSGNAIGPG